MKKKEEFEKQMDEVKGQVKAIAKGVSTLRKTGLRDELLYISIQRAAGTVGSGYKKHAVNIGTIKAVLKGIDGLYDYMFPVDDLKALADE